MLDSPPERIITRRLVIRRESADDAVAVADAIGRNRGRLLPWHEWVTDDAAKPATQIARITLNGKHWDAAEAYDYGIFDLPHGSFLGKIGMHRRIGPGGVELGYWLDAAAEGRGVISEAVSALVREALQLGDVDRVEIHCDAANSRSHAVPRRLGFVLDRIEHKPISAEAEIGEHMVWVYQPDCR